MTPDPWLAALAAELRRRGVETSAVANVVAEAAAHLRDSGESPIVAFGPAERYAAAIAETLTGPGPATHVAGTAAAHGDGATARGEHGDGAAARGDSGGRVRLRATGITKRYRRRTVLSGVDLTVRAGQIAAVVGANGCGKSTFLGVCAGLIAPDAGTVTVDGQLGYCPQDGGTVDFLVPDEHFVLVGAGAGLTREAARARGRAGAARLGWEAAGAPTAHHLSGGTRQKLNLVMTTLHRPDVLLLDEPYQGFDRGTYVNFWDQLHAWRASGTAIVVVTHLLNRDDDVDLVLDLTEVAA
jgi:ABC-type Mn2+/Zn2+ transport system ATPase subunit